MTLEVSVSEVIVVDDVFESIKRFFAKVFKLFIKDDEEADTTETTDEDDNKSPPVTEQSAPTDIGINVNDNAKPGESFGP